MARLTVIDRKVERVIDVPDGEEWFWALKLAIWAGVQVGFDGPVVTRLPYLGLVACPDVPEMKAINNGQ